MILSSGCFNRWIRERIEYSLFELLMHAFLPRHLHERESIYLLCIQRPLLSKLLVLWSYVAWTIINTVTTTTTSDAASWHVSAVNRLKHPSIHNKITFTFSCVERHGGAVASTVPLQQEGHGFISNLGSLRVLWVLPTVQRHAY